MEQRCCRESRIETGVDVTGTTVAPFHVGLTPELVVDAAVDLTRASHLMTWSIRDLASRLGVAPSVVYHHVGGKDLLCRRVVERVLALIELPPDGLDWRDWYRRLLSGIGPLAAQYPGVAKWMLLHGPTIPAALPVLETGTRVLRAAGFGERASLAYALLLNNAMLTVAIGDDRRQHEGDGPRDHATMMAEFAQTATASDELREAWHGFIGPYLRGDGAAARMREAYYRVVIDTTIAGLEAMLAGTTPEEPA